MGVSEGSSYERAKASLLSNRKIVIAGAVVVVAAAIVVVATGIFPPNSSQTAGTIAPAARYVAPQNTVGDVPGGGFASGGSGNGAVDAAANKAVDKAVDKATDKALANAYGGGLGRLGAGPDTRSKRL